MLDRQVIPATATRRENTQLFWTTQHQGAMQVGAMTRGHVRNTLQWCIRKLDEVGPDVTKDGLYYSEWIAIFTARLLDPALPDLAD